MNLGLFITLLVALFFMSQVELKKQSNVKKIIQQKQAVSPSPSPTPTSPPLSNFPTPTTIKALPEGPTLFDLFMYPNSLRLESSTTELSLKSQDDANVITNWYKEKIKTLKMNAQSFVTTNTNGNILNKLVASNGRQEIRVEITKNGGITVNILVTILNLLDKK